MGGTSHAIIYRDAAGNVRNSVGLLNGIVYEVVNARSVAISIGNALSVDWENGSIPAFFPSAAEISNPPATVLAATLFYPDGDPLEMPPLGVALDAIPASGGVGRVAGPGCVVPVLLDSYNTNHKYAVAGLTAGVCATSEEPIIGRTLGMLTALYVGRPGLPDYCGCWVHPIGALSPPP